MFKKLLRKLIRLLSGYEIKERQYALGMTSYIDKDKDIHIPILDYDCKELNKVLDDVNELMNFFNLSDYEVYETKQGFHIFFWYDHISYSRLRMIINYSNLIDPLYKYLSSRYDKKTIRAAGKYKRQDIHYIGKFTGKRTPTKSERELGELKKQEYLLLKDQKLFTDDVLKSTTPP